jgi:UDP-2,4-diacetamido-2,4,6-trideoxy-beta-L-altropyranose hydrolase
MKIAFRVDSSSSMGTGHLSRCLSLAEQLHALGSKVVFVSRILPGDTNSWIGSRGFELRTIGAELSEIEDADATRRALGLDCDWLIVDSYELGQQWRHVAKGIAKLLMVIDDLAEGPIDCNLVLNQNASEHSQARYLSLVGPATTVLSGPRYALLSGDFSRLSRPRRSRDGIIRNVVIFFGGTDPQEISLRALEALSDSRFDQLEVCVIVGPNYPNRPRIRELASTRPGTRVLGPQTDFAGLLDQADVAIGAGGVTMLERCSLGLPSIVVTVARNQEPGSRALAALGGIEYIGSQPAVRSADIGRALVKLLASPASVARMSELASTVVDGFGARRVAEVLIPSPTENLCLREAVQEDVYDYFQWTNDPAVRLNSFSQERIGWDEHKEWFERKLVDATTRLFVLMTGDLPVGQLRFEERSGAQFINYSIESAYRGRGWAGKLITLGLSWVRDMKMPIRAEVKSDNVASMRVFEGLGFRPIEGGKTATARVFEFQLDWGR